MKTTHFHETVTVFSVIILVILFCILFARWFTEYVREADYLNCEIKRTRGSEQKYWKKQKNKLWFKILINIFK